MLEYEVVILKFWKTAALFLIGGSGYVGLELLWRGRSHISMFLAGGICFLLLGKLNRIRPQLPLLLRGTVGAVVITSVELAAGLLVNRNFAVWDYRDQTGNFLGQICPLFTVLWIPVSMLALSLHGMLIRLMDRVKQDAST